MGIKKNKANSVLILFLFICFATVQIHANTGQRLLFARSYGSLFTSQSPGVRSFSGNEQAGWRGARNGPDLGNGALMILAGVAGNVVGIYAGALLGRSSYPGIILGGIAGSAGGRRGDFAAALGGSLLGEALAFGLALMIHTEDAPFLTGFFILPPIGAALAFNSSQRSRSCQAGNGLLNLAEGKLGLGVPDVHIRPVFVPGGGNAKPEMRFDVDVLSVEL